MKTIATSIVGVACLLAEHDGEQPFFYYVPFNAIHGPLDGMDMSDVLLDGGPSRREEMVIEVEGSVRLPTLRQENYKLVDDGR